MRIVESKYEKLLAMNQLTTQDISRESGLAYSTIYKAVKGNANVRPKTAGKIAKALNVSIEDIISGEEEDYVKGGAE